MDPHLTLGRDRDLGVADPHRHRSTGRGQRLAASVARTQIGRACVARDAHRLERQARDCSSPVDRHERSPPHDEVGIVFEGERAIACRGSLEFGQRQQGTRIALHMFDRQRAVQRVARLGLDIASPSGSLEEEPGDHRHLAETLREQRVVARQAGEGLAEISAASHLAIARCDRCGRGPIGLRQDDVVRYHGGPRLAQPAVQFGELGAGPRPLAEPRDRLFVDIDDRHPVVAHVSARRGGLVEIEHLKPQPLERRGVGKLQQDYQGKRCQPGQLWPEPRQPGKQRRHRSPRCDRRQVMVPFRIKQILASLAGNTTAGGYARLRATARRCLWRQGRATASLRVRRSAKTRPAPRSAGFSQVVYGPEIRQTRGRSAVSRSDEASSCRT